MVGCEELLPEFSQHILGITSIQFDKNIMQEIRSRPSVRIVHLSPVIYEFQPDEMVVIISEPSNGYM